MKKKRYALVKERNSAQQWIYGIAVLEEASSMETTELYRVNNVTCDKKAMESLVLRCNSLNLSPIHLDEVIEDFLLSE